MTVPSLYRLPYIAPLDLYRIPYIVWVSSQKAALDTSLNLKSVTVGKIWLQKKIKLTIKIKILQYFQIFGIVMIVYKY